MSKLYPTVLALAFLLAACLDDPLAVDGHNPPISDEFADLVAAAANYQGDAITIESFRPRLAVSLQFDGRIVPDGTVTLTIEGVAQEKLTGGDVRVILPTRAAMDHAGADKRPSYPVGKEIPAFRSWSLPVLDAGDQWKQTVEITLPPKGYYHVSVLARTTAPDDKITPDVFDFTDTEAWLLVTDDGGLVTDFFDSSVLPAGMVPSEGPFRAIPSGGASSAMAVAADGVMAYASDDISIHLVYYDGGTRKNAAGAKLTLAYKRGSTTVRTVTRTVPTSGIVAAACPASDEHIEASALVPTTAEVYAQFNIATFYLGTSDCGDTVQESSRHTYYIPWKNLNDAIPVIERHFDQRRGRISWRVKLSEGSSFYQRRSDRITFNSTGYRSLWVAGHEFGHGLHHRALGGMWDNDNCSPHYVEQPSSYTCAFSEGFADYAGSVGRGSTHADWEYRHWSSSGHDDAEIEGNIAALLNDLIDSNSDSSDRTDYPPDYVADVFETCRASGSDRDDVTDFVWCLENRVNEAVHDTGFPRGPDAPSSVSEGASEPSDWDAEDIRAVWWKNVT